MSERELAGRRSAQRPSQCDCRPISSPRLTAGARPRTTSRQGRKPSGGWWRNHLADPEAFRQQSAEHFPLEHQQVMMAEVDRRYLSPVPTYWDQAHSILTERVRFSLYGALGVIAAGSSAIIAADVHDLQWPAYLAFGALAVSVGISWSAHGLLETLAYDRVTDRITQYQNAMSGLFPGGSFKAPTPEAFNEARDAPIRRSSQIRVMANISAGAAMMGAALLFIMLANALQSASDAAVPIQPSVRSSAPAVAPPVKAQAG